MLKIENLKAKIDEKNILTGLNLEIKSGEVHALMGPNGSGKSTLSNVLSGKKGYEISGNVMFENKNLLDLAIEERAHKGIFLAFQYPLEIPGVNTNIFLKTTLNAIKKSRGEKELDAIEFLKIVKEKALKLKFDEKILSRQLNVGFSGGEKKKNEILQMSVLNPKLSILDETDSVNFLKYMPPTIFTKNIEEIKKFVKKYKKIVIKPIHGYGGKNILFVNKSINQIKVLNHIKKFGHIMVQKFISQVTKGDKRVFIINGLVKGAIQRVPLKGSFISNLAQGGKAIETKLNYKELKISKIVAKHLKKKQIFFAGIDLVSNYLIGDINVTSPTGLKNFKDLSGINLAKDFWNNLEKLK